MARSRTELTRLAAAVALFAAGALAGTALATSEPPTEHKGLKVESLGKVAETSMRTQIGLEGHVLQLRAITIEPGGQIARHSHATRPGLVKVVSGTWVEGRPSGEAVYGADTPGGILEDAETDHWFFNRGDEPATAIVCDIVPAG